MDGFDLKTADAKRWADNRTQAERDVDEGLQESRRQREVRQRQAEVTRENALVEAERELLAAAEAILKTGWGPDGKYISLTEGMSLRQAIARYRAAKGMA